MQKQLSMALIGTRGFATLSSRVSGRPVVRRRRAFGVMVSCLVIACQPASESSGDQAAWRPPALAGDAGDIPGGREVVQRTNDFMSGLEQFTFEAFVTYGAVQETGQTLHFDMLQRLALRRPDRIFWITLHDDGTADSAWLDAGKFRMIKQPMNVWGEVNVPPTITEAFDRLVNEYGLDVPLADVLAGPPAELWLGNDVTSIEYVGEAWVDGFWTDHVAIRRPGADFELWIRQGDEPFPMRMVVVYTEEEGLPSYSARFRRWATALPEGALPVFTPPPDGERVEIVPVNEGIAHEGDWQ